MSNRYEIRTLSDLINLDEGQIERLCKELPAAIKQAKSMKEIIEFAGDLIAKDSVKAMLLDPLVWIDDEKKDITINMQAEVKDEA